jgi:hypothetical protein
MRFAFPPYDRSALDGQHAGGTPALQSNYRCFFAQKKVERPAWVMRRTPSAQVQPGHGSPSRP